MSQNLITARKGNSSNRTNDKFQKRLRLYTWSEERKKEMSQQVRDEILQTEKTYLHELRTYLEVIARPLKRHTIKPTQGKHLTNLSAGCGLTEQEVNILECNFEEIFQVSRDLLRDLEKNILLR